MKAIKQLIKRILPTPIKNLILGRKTKQVQKRYAGLSLSDTFDHIYASHVWGAAELSSGLGSTGHYISEYLGILQHWLSQRNVRSVADLGCGNFNTGKLVAGLVPQYTGVDIAQRVVDENTKAYGTKNIKFVRADLTTQTLPPADAAIVRQVLQHLSNEEISLALANILRTYPFALITEHVYIGPHSKPNCDFGHGPGTRIPMKSGVFIDQAPFNVRATQLKDIPYDRHEVLRTWVTTKL